MSAVVDVGWTLFAIASITLSLFSVGFVKHYQSRRDSELSATVVSMLSLAILFSTAALLPVDIFLVSSTVDPDTGLKKLWADEETIYWMTLAIQTMYYVFYGLIVTFCFFIIPFAYFYHEECEEEGRTKSQKRANALKYTMFFVVIVALLFLFGLFLKPSVLPPYIDLDWFTYLITESLNIDIDGAKTIWFVNGCLFIPGMAVYIFYTAPGLSMIAFKLIKGKRKIDSEKDEIDNRLAVVREHQRLIEHKYKGQDKALSSIDYRNLENLNDEERILVRRLNGIEEEESTLLQRILKIIIPFKELIGLILFAFILLLAVSMFMTLIDKVAFSECGSECGYIISNPNLFNPLNAIFIRLQKIFPMDYILMICIIIYFLLATMTGIVNIGVRLLWVSLYRIKRASTTPQGLLFTSILLSFGLLAFNYSIISVVAPGYAHYGNQVYCNYTQGGIRDCSGQPDQIFSCDIYAPIEICTPTVSSILIDRITLNTPLFGFIFYYSQWLFLASFILGFLINLFKPPSNHTEETELLCEEEEAERGLLDSNGHHSI